MPGEVFLQQLGTDSEGRIWDAVSDRPLLGGLTAAQVTAISGSSLESAGVDWALSPSLLVTRLNAALARGGLQTLTRPGQYVVGGPGQGGILLPSNTTLLCGDGVELIVADQTFQPLIRNAKAYAAGVAVTGNLVFSVGPSLIRANATGIHLTYPKGTPIAVLGLDATNAANRGYQGVYVVDSVTTDAIFFNIPSNPPSGGDSGPGAIIYPADINCKIIGGMWDGNEAGTTGSGYTDGDPRQFVNGFRNVWGLTVQGTKYRRGESWCIGTNNIRAAEFLDIYADLGDTGAAQAHAILQMAGGSRDVLIDGIRGRSTDNLVAHSLDALTGTATYPNYWPGDSYNTRIKNVTSDLCLAALVALWGNTNYRHHYVEIDGVYGRSAASAVQVLGGYAPTDMLNASGGELIIKNLAGAFASSPVFIQSGGTWENIDIDTVRNLNTGIVPLVSVTRGSLATQTIKKFSARNLAQFVQGAGNNRNQPVVDIVDSNIGQLYVEECPEHRFTGGTSFVRHSGTLGTIGNAAVEKIAGVANTSGDSFLVSCENTNATALGRLVVRDASWTGTGATGGIVRQATTGRVTTVLIDNSAQTGGEGIYVSDNVVNPAASTVRAP